MIRVIRLVVLICCGALCSADAEEAFSRHFAAATRTLPPITETAAWRPVPGETLTFIGGTTALETGTQGQFEMALQSAFPESKPRVRNLGWHGDTVFRQQRPLFFYTREGDSRPGSVPDQRQRVDPGTLFLFFGKMESLESDAEAFRAAYELLVDDLLTVTPRIFLVSPTDFEKTGPAAALADERNQTLETFREILRQIATSRGIGVLAPQPSAESTVSLTRDGVHLNELGHARQVDSLMAQFGQFAPPKVSGEFVAAVARKERLWDQYYRPTNWAFLFGDRQHVPSSRDHIDAEQRWFVREIQALEPLIAEADRFIHQLAQP